MMDLNQHEVKISSLDWVTFKSSLGYSENITVAYIDEEGSRIPIENECQFQEALRLAKLFGNRLQLILYYDTLNRSGSGRRNKLTEPTKMDKHKRNCPCNEEVLPDWFTHYMITFKKELLNDLKSSIQEIVHSALEEETLIPKSGAVNIISKSETDSSPAKKQSKNKKGSDRESSDLIEQREVKLLKKIEKLHPSKFERLESRLEKLDKRIPLEERKKLSERKCHIKSRLERKVVVSERKSTEEGKSALFPQNELKMYLPPKSQVAITFSVVNNGTVPWVYPLLECFYQNGFSLEEKVITLPKLKPGESGLVTLKGRLTHSVGLCNFKCRLLDGFDPFGPLFTCWVRVSRDESASSIPASCSGEDLQKEFENSGNPDVVSLSVKFNSGSEQLVGTLFEVEKDVIAKSQKKIEENIIEIERRLHDIDLFRTSSDVDVKGEEKGTERMVADSNAGRDSSENLQEVDIHHKAEEETVKKEEGNNEKTNLNALKKNGEYLSGSDSELSVIYVSEDEYDDESDNFIMVPLLSTSPTPNSAGPKVETSHKSHSGENSGPVDGEPNTVAVEESSKEDEKIVGEASAAEEPRLISMRSKTFSVPTAEEVSEKPFGRSGNANVAGDSSLSSTRSRKSPFEEEIFESRTKKLKSSKSTEYAFTGADLNQSPPVSRPEETFERSRGKPGFSFTFNAEKQSENATEEKEKEVPKMDAPKKVTYAVDLDGYCLPVESPQESSGNFSSGSPALNFIPDVLNAAKNVISTLHLTLGGARRIGMGKAAWEKSKVSRDAMYMLYEMGFSDFQTNRKLLQIHNNNLEKVIDELILLSEKQQ